MSRQAVVDAAIAELGKPNSGEYWSSALGKASGPQRLAWCGIFALYCLHKAGLALGTFWTFSLGFLTKPDRTWFLPKTQAPQPGDIGYRDQPFQHHFIVEAVDGDMVHSIDGNSGAYSTVNRCTHPIGHGCTYFSIAKLVGEPESQVYLPSPSKPPSAPHSPTPAVVQHALNTLMLKHPLEHDFPLLTIDGIIGPKSQQALRWAQQILHIPISGQIDAATLDALGLSHE